MATSLSELLDDIHDLASLATPGPSVADDARRALAQLGSALNRLALDGVGGLDGERVRWVHELAAACARTGRPPVVADGVSTPGRLTQLSSAASVTATLFRDEVTGGDRWATAVAITDTVHRLTGLAGLAAGSDPSPAAVRALVVVDAAGTVVSRFAALDPPTAEQTAVLDRPVPDPFPAIRTLNGAIAESVAALVHASRPLAGPHSLAAILAVSIAAETVCRVVERVPGNDRTSEDSRRAVAAWAHVRVVMSPFNDGSRRRQTTTPPTAGYALTLHRTLLRAEREAAGPQRTVARSVVAAAVQHTPVLAQHLGVAIRDAASRGHLLAYARDLPFREVRVEQFLAGHRPRGLVAADQVDIGDVTEALTHAEHLSAALAKRVRAARTSHDAPNPTPTVARPPRVEQPGAVQRSCQERSDAAVHAAARAVQARQPTSTPRR